MKEKEGKQERNLLMNKKRLLLITGLALTLSITGCGNKKETAETETSSSQSNIITGYLIDNADQYVTLGTYKGISVEKPVYEVTEDEINMEIENRLYEQSSVQETDRNAETGDILTVDLKATIDGETDPYMEEEDYSIELGYEEFGSAFDEALTGTKAGDKKSISCSFTEDDGYEDWTGKTVNFEVSVKKIEELIIPEYNDEFIKSAGYDTMEEFEKDIKENLTASYEEQSVSEARYNALLTAMDDCQFSGYPDKLYDSCAKSVEEQYTFFAETSGMTQDELFEAFDMTQEDLDNEILEAVNIRLFISALCQKENLTVTDEEYADFLDEQYPQYGYEDSSSFESEYGKEYILWALYENKASAFLLENASVDEVEYTYDGDDYDADSDYGEELAAIEDMEADTDNVSGLPENENVQVAKEQQNGE